jgi:hypothetical protein
MCGRIYGIGNNLNLGISYCKVSHLFNFLNVLYQFVG